MKILIFLFFFSLIFISFINFILIFINFLDFIPLQTRGTVWYKLETDTINNLFIKSFFMFFSGIIYFKFIEPKLSKDKKQIEYSKCPKCKETFTYKNLKDGKCPNCKDIDTIDIEEYYKKYPEE